MSSHSYQFLTEYGLASLQQVYVKKIPKRDIKYVSDSAFWASVAKKEKEAK